MPEYIQTLIAQPSTDIFRRLHIKRRNLSNGLFESTWQDMTEYVKRWGSIESTIDAVRLNDFQNSGYNVVVNNDTGRFQEETFYNSFWRNYMPRYKSLVRVQAGLLDSSDTEFPTDTTQGIFVLTDEIPVRSDSNDITLKCSSLRSIFDDVLARDIAGITPTLTASQIWTAIRDHTDGSSNFIFREYITSTAWTIAATTQPYLLNTTTNLDGLSAWDLMQKLAEAEGLVVLINRTGGIEFAARAARTTTSQFTLFGQNFPRPNIIKIQEYKEDLNNYYNYFRLKYLEADTSTSFVTAGTTTAVTGSNTSWSYGQRIYEFENLFITGTTTAQTLVNSLFSGVGATLTSIGNFHTLFLPDRELLDRVDVNYHSYNLGDSTIWDVFDWDGANWSVEGENFDWDSKNFVIYGKKIDLDNMTSNLTLREV